MPDHDHSYAPPPRRPHGMREARSLGSVQGLTGAEQAVADAHARTGIEPYAEGAASPWPRGLCAPIDRSQAAIPPGPALGGPMPPYYATHEEAVAARSGERPSGVKGQKLARFDLLPWDALAEVAEHYGRGAKSGGGKYDDRNWERGYAWSLSFAALHRHLAAFWNGEDIDPDSGSPHLAAVVFHALALLAFARRFPEHDDRPGV